MEKIRKIYYIEILEAARPPMSIRRDWLFTDPEEEDREEDELEMEGLRIIA